MTAQKPDAPTVLVAPLDWGLGHASRCIPVINILQKNNCHILVAAEGASRHLLQKEFPHLHFLSLEGYHIRYGQQKWSTIVRLIGQIPKILRTIKTEHRWLQQVVEIHHVDAVIADNRYVYFHSFILFVFLPFA